MNNFSYVTAAVNAIASYKNQYGLIATNVLRINNEPVMTSLLNAIAVSHDRAGLDATNHKFNDGPAPVAPPIAYLDFVQTVMNKVCGLARQDLRGKRTEDFGNGIDFTQDLTDQIGFSVDEKEIESLVNEDFYTLNNLHCYIAQGMPYLDDIPALRYHAQSTKLDDGTWVKTDIADSFEDALAIMEERAAAYAEEQAMVRQGESATVDFSARDDHPSPEQLKEQGDKYRESVAA